MTNNPWCQALGIVPPTLEAVVGHREANTYSLLLVALLERGAPMSLAAVATRFEEAGVAKRARALLSLQRCKPGRPPVYRDGDLYHLDPHDTDLDLWAFRLDLRPPKGAPAAVGELAPKSAVEAGTAFTPAERRQAMRTSPEEQALSRARWEKARATHGAQLARLSRALIVAFPPDRPQAAALLDLGQHQITTYVGDELAALRERLASFDIIGGVEVRGLLRALQVDPGARRLAELSPPQKTKRLARSGRTLTLTTAMMVQTSCNIERPFTDEARLAAYLDKGQLAKLRLRLGHDLQSLYALYEYGRLHGFVHLGWGRLDQRFPATWAHPDEPRLHDLKQTAQALDVPLEVLSGFAPGWEKPWAYVRLAYVRPGRHPWELWLVDANGCLIPDSEVQRARLPVEFN